MGQRAQLNDIFIRNLPIPAEGRAQYPDGKLPGFGVRVSSNGLKVFYLTYRFAGQSRRMILGRYPYKTLAAARAEAHTALGQIASGIDPQASAPASAVGSAQTFNGVLDQFLDL